MNFIGIIPARYNSVRFPGKPLAIIKGKPMIQRVYEQALKALDAVYVATDDDRIYGAVKNFKGNVVMTKDSHKTGTERCAEAIQIVENETQKEFDVIINIQGDEPFIDPFQIKNLTICFDDPAVEIATLITPFKEIDGLVNPNRVKVVINSNKEALLFSRSVIPYIRDEECKNWLKKHEFYLHIGLYAFRKDILYRLVKLEPTPLEQIESLEQLRWLENGFKIKTELTRFDSIGIDAPEDLEKLKNMK